MRALRPPPGFVLLLHVLAGAAAGVARADATIPTFTAVESTLAAPHAGDRAYTIDSLTIEIGRGRVRLGPGTLVPARPLGERAWGAAFLGRVAAEYAPLSALERGELRRRTGAERWSGTSGAVLLALPPERIAAAIEGRPAAAFPGRGERTPAAVLAAFARDGVFAWPGLVQDLLAARADYALVVDFEGDHPRWAVECDGRDREASSLYLAAEKGDDLELASTEALAPPAPGEPPGARRPQFVAEATRVDATIADDLEVRQATTVLARMHESGPVWVPFHLMTKLTLDSAYVDGVPVPSGQDEDALTVWVRVPEGIDRGMACEIRLVTRGRPLAREGDWIALESSIGWLPQHDARQRVPYDLTFRSPKSYRLVSVGDCVSNVVEGNRIVTRWVVAQPARNPTFAIGPFDETKLGDPRLPALTVYMSKAMQRRVREQYGEGEVGGDLSAQALADLANAQKFYRTMFGEPYDTTIVATEIPDSRGEAYPGLVNLSWETFSDVTGPWWPRHMRAHEMAHQWWPIGVEFATYHDQWLSEGLADFCSLWFQQVSDGDARHYFEQLELWRRDIVPRRWTATGNPEEASPIALGGRIAARRGTWTRPTILYYKGAWVIHMLRALLLDPRTMRDDRFAALLRDVYRAQRGRTLSTAQFQAAAERQAGGELGWFFREWVEGTAIPDYRWAWRKEALAGGKWKVEVRVRAAQVPDDFRMPVPVRVDLGDGKSVRFRVDVVGPSGMSAVEGIDFEPRGVAFNEHAAVLCEAHEERW